MQDFFNNIFIELPVRSDCFLLLVTSEKSEFLHTRTPQVSTFPLHDFITIELLIII